MNLEDQVCSLELAKRLKELGIIKPSIFGWIYHEHSEAQAWACKHAEPNSSWHIIRGTDDIKPITWNGNDKEVAAFTVAELGEMLPDCIHHNELLKNKNTTLLDLNGHFIKSSKKDDEYKIYIAGLTKVTIFFSKNEANARASMLIYLLENGLMEKD